MVIGPRYTAKPNDKNSNTAANNAKNLINLNTPDSVQVNQILAVESELVELLNCNLAIAELVSIV